VTDDGGATAAATHAVTVANRAPDASFGYTPDPPLTNQTVTFTSTSTDPDGTIAAQEGNKLEIAFETGGTKRVIDSFVRPA